MSNTSFKKGAHIRVEIKKSLGAIYHHGIYLGDDQVIHFHKPLPLNIPKINQTHIDDFGDGGQPELVSYSSFPDYTVELARELMLLANARIDKRVMTKEVQDYVKAHTKYNLLDNNCEHLADFCVTGGRSNNSKQTSVVKSVLKYIEDNEATLMMVLNDIQRRRA